MLHRSGFSGMIFSIKFLRHVSCDESLQSGLFFQEGSGDDRSSFEKFSDDEHRAAPRRRSRYRVGKHEEILQLELSSYNRSLVRTAAGAFFFVVLGRPTRGDPC